MRQPNSDLCFYVVNLIFAYLLFMVELGYQKVKIRKSQRENEN